MPYHRPRHIFRFELSRVIHWLGLLMVCAAYLATMDTTPTSFPRLHADIVLDGAGYIGCTLVLIGRLRWFGALLLVGLVVVVTFLTRNGWQLVAADRLVATHWLSERAGLVGGLILIAWIDVAERNRI